MKKYEIMILTKGSAGEAKFKQTSKNLQDLVEGFGGKVESNDVWGKRRLAYNIKSETEGYYEVVNFEMPQDKLSGLKTKLNLENDLVRYLITARS